MSSPSPSAMPLVSAVSVSPTWAVPLMVGAPVARLLGRAATAAVAALVRVSSLSASSVKLTRTLMVLPWSAGNKGVGRTCRVGNGRVVRQPLITEGGIVQPILVRDVRGGSRQRLPHLRRAADGGQARGRTVDRLAATAPVAPLVSASALFLSSVKDTRTWMVCPCWLVVRV